MTEKSVTPEPLPLDHPRVQLALKKMLKVQPVLRVFYAVGFYVGAFLNSTRIGYREGQGKF